MLSSPLLPLQVPVSGKGSEQPLRNSHQGFHTHTQVSWSPCCMGNPYPQALETLDEPPGPQQPSPEALLSIRFLLRKHCCCPELQPLPGPPPSSLSSFPPPPSGSSFPFFLSPPPAESVPRSGRLPSNPGQFRQASWPFWVANQLMNTVSTFCLPADWVLQALGLRTCSGRFAQSGTSEHPRQS